MTTRIPPLIEILADVPDPRAASGRRYPLAAMLTLVCVGLLCGYRNIYAISEWGANYGDAFLEQLGFSRHHGYPAQATWYRVLRQVDVDLVAAKLENWLERVVAVETHGRLGVSIDGKTLRVSKKMGARDSHLLTAVAHGLGVTLGQWAVDDHTNEIGMMGTVLLDLALVGRVVTTDALLTQKDVARTILERGGDYVFALKDNQPNTKSALENWFAIAPTPEARPASASSIDKKHARLEIRQIETRVVPMRSLDWPGVHQAFKLTRHRICLKDEVIEAQTAYGITSLAPEQANAADLLTFIRQHWTIENQLHWVKDVVLDEDRCQLRKGRTHQLMALFRSLILSLLRFARWPSPARALRTLAAQPHRAIHFLTLPFGER